MSHTLKKLTLALISATALMAHAGDKLGSYSPVTDARLQNPEPGNWLMYRGNYNGWGYSPLEKINSKNVKKLTLAWSSATGVTEGHQAPPIVNNGYMYVTTPVKLSGMPPLATSKHSPTSHSHLWLLKAKSW